MTGNYNQYNSKDYTYFLIQDKNHLKIQEKNINIKKRPFNEEKTRRVVCLQSERRINYPSFLFRMVLPYLLNLQENCTLDMLKCLGEQ